MFYIFQVVAPSSTLRAGRNLRYREITRPQVVWVGLNPGHLASAFSPQEAAWPVMVISLISCV